MLCERVISAGADWRPTESGIFLPENLARRRSRPTGIDLFCGCGGFSLGFIHAGFEVVAALDYDAPATMTYLHNLGAYPVDIHYVEPGDKDRLEKQARKELARFQGDVRFANAYGSGFHAGGGWRHYNQDKPGVSHFWFGDVRKVTGQQILDAAGLKPGEVDCVFGGPPCQGYSSSGKRDIMDPRNSLVFEFTRLVLEIQPKTFVMENVPGILSMVTPEGTPVLDAMCIDLERGGYGMRDALKRALVTSAGCGAAVKGKTRGEKERERRMLDAAEEAKGWDARKPEQMDLFGEAT